MPSKPQLAEPGALIRNGKLRTDEFRVCLDPDLIAEYERLIVAKAAAEQADSNSLAGGRTAEIDAEIATALEQIEAQTIILVLRALPRPEFRALKDKHPPRRDAEGRPDLSHPLDLRFGVNTDMFFEPLVRAELISPVLDEEALTMLIEERLTDGQWDALSTLAWNLNLQQVDVPFSSAVSPNRRNSSRR